MERYKHLNTYLKEKYGERVLKICIDGGFTCPNRDGTKAFGGCIFCSGLGSGEHLKLAKPIDEQVKEWIKYKSGRANKFIVYFQSFSGTYAPLDELRNKYLAAILASDQIVGLDIATRPDCITPNIAELLAEFNNTLPVTVELGLQSVCEQNSKLLNKHYSSQDFELAVKLLAEKNISVVAHIMVGLPNETHEDLVKTIDFINSLPVVGIKIHSTYVLKNTGLEQLYISKKYSPLEFEKYVSELEYILTHIRPDIVIHRISGDPPKDLLVAPLWCKNKKLVLNGIDKLLTEKNLYQGIYYKK